MDLEPRAVYTYCYGHALNLAAGDTLKQCKVTLKQCKRIPGDNEGDNKAHQILSTM